MSAAGEERYGFRQLRAQAAREGLVPLKAWVKGVLDEIVQVCLKQPDLEFAWVGDDAVAPLQQARTLSLLVGAGMKTRDEARAELGLAPAPAAAPGTPLGRDRAGVAKFNPYHDPSNGQFTTPDGAGSQNPSIAPVADTTSSKYFVKLGDEENRGGHTIRRHVDRTDADMLAEAGTPRSIGDFDVYKAVGRFASLSDANNFVNRILEQNAASVDAVAAGTISDAWLKVRFGYPTCTEAILTDDSGIPRFRPTYYVGLQIIHDETSPNGYTVWTAYPLNKYPNETHF